MDKRFEYILYLYIEYCKTIDIIPEYYNLDDVITESDKMYIIDCVKLYIKN